MEKYGKNMEKYGKIWQKMEKMEKYGKIWKGKMYTNPPIFHHISWENYGKLRRKMKEHWKIEGEKLKLPRSSRRVDIGWKSKITTKPHGK